MIKRILDIAASGLLLIVTLPIQLIALVAIYMQDKAWPIYSPPRSGKNGIHFNMHKMRTMTATSDCNKIYVTSSDDQRITKVGAILRRYKIDELLQLWNVLVGEMSLVGPRPQVTHEVDRYTEVEKGLLAMRPGITDFSSIVFSDLAQIVEGSPDTNLTYSQLVRPWKSRLGLFYVAHSSLWVDIALMALTVVAIVSREHALRGVAWMLERLNAPPELVEFSRRRNPLTPMPPPGMDSIITKID